MGLYGAGGAGIFGMSISQNSQIISGSGVFVKVAETTLGANATSVTFSGVNLVTDKRYYIVYRYKFTGGAGDGGVLKLYLNGDTTDTNYYTQTLDVTGATVAGSYNNHPQIDNENNGAIVAGYLILAQINGEHPHGIGLAGTTRGNNQNTRQVSVWRPNTGTVTSITLTNSFANGLGAGGTFVLYKMA